MEDVLLAYPRTALQIMENMADRFINLVALTADLSLQTALRRFAKLLLEQAEGDLIERRYRTTQTETAHCARRVESRYPRTDEGRHD